MAGIKIYVVDLENGDAEEVEIQPGQYHLVCADPLYLDEVVRDPNGTIVLTIKRRSERPKPLPKRTRLDAQLIEMGK